MQLVVVLVHGGDGLVACRVLVHLEHDCADRLPLVDPLQEKFNDWNINNVNVRLDALSDKVLHDFLLLYLVEDAVCADDLVQHLRAHRHGVLAPVNEC